MWKKDFKFVLFVSVVVTGIVYGYNYFDFFYFIRSNLTFMSILNFLFACVSLLLFFGLDYDDMTDFEVSCYVCIGSFVISSIVEICEAFFNDVLMLVACFFTWSVVVVLRDLYIIACVLYGKKQGKKESKR